MLRELLLALHGHPGDVFIKEEVVSPSARASSSENSTQVRKSVIRIDPKFTLIHPSERKGYDRLAQLGVFYTQLKEFSSLFRYSEVQECSIYLNALKLGIANILEGYEELLVKVESGFLLGRDFDYGSTKITYLTGIFTHYRIILPDLVKFVETVLENKLKGGEILSLVYQRSFTGVPFLEKSYAIIASACNRVFYNQVLLWVGCGRLNDPFKEFFIKFEEEKYQIESGMIPAWLSESARDSILFIGRVVSAVQKIDPNHSSQHLQKKATERLTALAQREKLSPLEFDLTISELRREISAELWINFFSRHLDLKSYIRDFRNLFLLRFGGYFSDFFNAAQQACKKSNNGLLLNEIDLLFTTNSPGFDHQCASNLAKFKFKKIEPVEYNFLGFLGCQVPIEWRYQLEWPLDLVLRKKDLSLYSKLFSYLAGVRYIHLDLTRLSELSLKPPNWWEPFWRTKAIMGHFLDSLWSYFQVDILDPAYFELLSDLENPELAYDFESIQRLHSNYLNYINFATLLGTKMAKHLLCLFVIVNKFTKISRRLLEVGSAPEERDLEELAKLDKDLIEQIKFIFRTLSSLSRNPTFSKADASCIGQNYSSESKLDTVGWMHVSKNLDQLLLRLDYNKWFSDTL